MSLVDLMLILREAIMQETLMGTANVFVSLVVKYIFVVSQQTTCSVYALTFDFFHSVILS